MENVVAPVPLETCNILFDKTEVSILGLVPTTIGHEVVSGMRYHDGVLLSPVVCRTDTNVDEVRSITFLDRTIHK